MKLLISTGEVSGDIVAARIATMLRERHAAGIFGIGGSRMQAAGVEILQATNHLGTVGVSESLHAIPALVRALATIRKRIASDRPDAALLIGNDIFNVVLGRYLRAKGIPTVSFFPPQVWIWGAVAWLFTRSFDVVATSFPEEQTTYGRHGKCVFVGHYLADILPPRTEPQRREARHRFGVAEGARVVAVLPGSRRHEIDRLAPLLLDAVSRVVATREDVRLLLPVSDDCFESQLRAEAARWNLGERLQIVHDSHDAMRAADLVVAASGTASLEATLLGVPIVVAYRVSRLTHNIVRAAIAARLMKGETMALPNLILGRSVVPELKQKNATAECVAAAVAPLLDDETLRARMRHELLSARAVVARPGTLEAVVSIVAQAASCADEVTSVAEIPAAAGS